MPRYELLVDGAGARQGGLRRRGARLAHAYCTEHAEDDPDATHVQVRRLSRALVADRRLARPAGEFFARQARSG